MQEEQRAKKRAYMVGYWQDETHRAAHRAARQRYEERKRAAARALRKTEIERAQERRRAEEARLDALALKLLPHLRVEEPW